MHQVVQTISVVHQDVDRQGRNEAATFLLLAQTAQVQHQRHSLSHVTAVQTVAIQRFFKSRAKNESVAFVPTFDLVQDVVGRPEKAPERAQAHQVVQTDGNQEILQERNEAVTFPPPAQAAAAAVVCCEFRAHSCQEGGR